MYLISIYFDKQTNKTLQWYIDKIAEKTNNYFMIENRVPPHMTIAAIEARNVNVLKPAFETLNGKLYSGSMKVVSVGQLFPYVMYATPVLNQELFELRCGIEKEGVLVPLMLRKNPHGDGYEIIDGHRRKEAALWAGLTKVPVIIRELDDDQSVIAMVDSNLQREKILPSEKAFAYKMRLEAMKHQGRAEADAS